MLKLNAKVVGIQRIKRKDNGTYAEVIVELNGQLAMIRLWSDNGFMPKRGETISVVPPLSGVWRVVEDEEVE